MSWFGDSKQPEPPQELDAKAKGRFAGPPSCPRCDLTKSQVGLRSDEGAGHHHGCRCVLAGVNGAHEQYMGDKLQEITHRLVQSTGVSELLLYWSTAVKQVVMQTVPPHLPYTVLLVAQMNRTIQNYQKAYRKKVEGLKAELVSTRADNNHLRSQVGSDQCLDNIMTCHGTIGVMCQWVRCSSMLQIPAFQMRHKCCMMQGQIVVRDLPHRPWHGLDS